MLRRRSSAFKPSFDGRLGTGGTGALLPLPRKVAEWLGVDLLLVEYKDRLPLPRCCCCWGELDAPNVFLKKPDVLRMVLEKVLAFSGADGGEVLLWASGPP